MTDNFYVSLTTIKNDKNELLANSFSKREIAAYMNLGK